MRKKGEKIVKFDPGFARLANEMIETMHAAAGIGLAAQQVGRPLMLCVADLRDTEAAFTWTLDGARPPRELFMPLVLANPHVTVTPGTTETVYVVGCLSFPKIRGDVARRDAIVRRCFGHSRRQPHRAPAR